MTQITIFLCCASFGIATGLIYDTLLIFRCPFAGHAANVVSDLLFCLLCALAFVWYAVECELYALRFYMVAACVAGFILYRKSFHKTVAFFVGKVYNKIAKGNYKQRNKRLWEKIVNLCRKKKRQESR